MRCRAKGEFNMQRKENKSRDKIKFEANMSECVGETDRAVPSESIEQRPIGINYFSAINYIRSLVSRHSKMRDIR